MRTGTRRGRSRGTQTVFFSVHNTFLIVNFMGSTISVAEVLRETGAVGVLADALFAYIGPMITGTFQLDAGPVLVRVRRSPRAGVGDRHGLGLHPRPDGVRAEARAQRPGEVGLFFLLAENVALLLVVPIYWPLIGIR